MITIPINHLDNYRIIPRNNTLRHSITNSCNKPSKVALVDLKGNCYVCDCEAWLPVSVGYILDFDCLSKIWNTSAAQALQQDIDQKQFTHCAVNRCGILDHDININSHEISINIDESCNLACPSCRKHSIMHTNGVEFNTKLLMADHLVNLIEKFESPLNIVMSGNGDPLASAIMRPLIHRFQPRVGQTIRLFTNGLLLEKQLSSSPILNHVTSYFISTDAGSATVYEQVRAPGRWDQLLKNLDFLKSVVDRNGAQVLLKFVLQRNNWRDQENFIRLCKHYGFRGEINRLENWSTWDKFSDHDVVGNTEHTEHAEAMAELKRVHTLYPNRSNQGHTWYFDPNLINLLK